MNKIVLACDNIDLNIDDSITCQYLNDDVIKKLNIKILNDTKLEIYLSQDIKIDINIDIEKNVNCNILELKECAHSKVQIKYNLKENSYLKIDKIHNIKKIFERNIINLKGKNAKVDYILKTISKDEEKYDLTINHQAENTNSLVINNAVNVLNGNITFNVTSSVLKGKKNCIVNQNNRIINLTNNNCIIRPILLIDDVDTTANHSALIGNFKDEEYFYLQRLGIDKELATKLLLEGFIKSNSNYPDILEKMYKEYWR